MKKYLAYSSETYLLPIAELLLLEKSSGYEDSGEPAVLAGSLKHNQKETLFCGAGVLEKAQAAGEEYYPVRFVYYTYHPLPGFFINLLKPVKRRFYQEGIVRFHMRLKDILAMNLKRGVRDERNAYNWTNKRWAMSLEERHKRYDTLYQSLKQNGYDDKSPIFVMINRNLGARDQLFQGHHRLNICKELGIEKLSVCFWTSVPSPRFMAFFEKIVSKIRGMRK